MIHYKIDMRDDDDDAAVDMHVIQSATSSYFSSCYFLFFFSWNVDYRPLGIFIVFVAETSLDNDDDDPVG